jgi:uncharacterized protein YgiM (DUF1202 family)
MAEKTTKTKKIVSKTSKKTAKEPETEVKEGPKTITAIVATDRYPLNIRNAAESEANIIGQIPKGSKIKVLDEPINGFYQLADQPGFVLGSKLKI